MSAPKISFRSFFRSLKPAIHGIKRLYAGESNARIQLALFTMVILVALLLHISATEWILVLLASGMVMSAEAFNTAVEKMADMVQPYPDPRVKLIKDLAAGAVLITAIFAAIAGAFIFVPRFMALF